MRHRKIKRATPNYLKSIGVFFEPIDLSAYQDKMIYLEIGSGKGKFITSLALDNPDCLYLAIERDANAIIRLAEASLDLGLKNLLIFCMDANQLLEIFQTIKINKLFLNFSDPWPKSKHHKRRLTYPTMLNLYKQILSKDGQIQFRTDSLDLFNDSLLYFESCGFQIIKSDLNLKESKYMTEYEEKKRVLGPIYQVEVKLNE